MQTKRIGILRGGPSSEYDVSLKTGAAVFRNLPKKYTPIDILISKDGLWHMNGLPTIPARVLPHLDCVFNALHGEYGEDGTVQKILEHWKIPYTGSKALASAIGMNKSVSKKFFKNAGLRVPYSISINSKDFVDIKSLANHIFKKFSLPFVAKPIRGGSSVGVIIAKKFEDIINEIPKVLNESDEVLLEEYIRGREVTCGVVDNFRDESHHALMPIEIIMSENSQFFDYKAKYSGETKELCPSVRLSIEEKKEIEKAAILAHQTIGARHYSRSDFIVSPRGIYILEINTLPGLTEESLLPKSLLAGGTTFQEFLEHIITEII